MEFMDLVFTRVRLELVIQVSVFVSLNIPVMSVERLEFPLLFFH